MSDSAIPKILEWPISCFIAIRTGIKKQTVTNIGQDVEKGDPVYTVDKTINWYSHYEK